MQQKTYFGLDIISNGSSVGVAESQIKKLPFYEYWLQKSRGSTVGVINDKFGNKIDLLVYLHDWEKFCRIFINTSEYLDQADKRVSKTDAKLISTTNPAMARVQEMHGKLSFDGVRATFSPYFRTSSIVGYEINDDNMTLQTMNSTYIFKIYGEMILPPLARVSAKKQAVLDFQKAVKSRKFYCTITSDSGLLDGLSSTITFKEPITRNEALHQIAANDLADDNCDGIVDNVLSACEEADVCYGLNLHDISGELCIDKNDIKDANLLKFLDEFIATGKINLIEGKFITKEMFEYFLCAE